MSLYVLDTDHASLLQRGHRPVIRQVAAKSDNVIAVTVIAVTVVTAEEQLRGRLRVIRRAASGPQLSTAYAGLRTTIEYFKNVELLDFGPAAAAEYAELRSRKIRVGALDLRIAAVVLAAGGVLVTRNHQDFVQVPGLRIEDWSR